MRKQALPFWLLLNSSEFLKPFCLQHSLFLCYVKTNFEHTRGGLICVKWNCDRTSQTESGVWRLLFLVFVNFAAFVLSMSWKKYGLSASLRLGENLKYESCVFQARERFWWRERKGMRETPRWSVPIFCKEHDGDPQLNNIWPHQVRWERRGFLKRGFALSVSKLEDVTICIVSVAFYPVHDEASGHDYEFKLYSIITSQEKRTYRKNAGAPPVYSLQVFSSFMLTTVSHK